MHKNQTKKGMRSAMKRSAAYMRSDVILLIIALFAAVGSAIIIIVGPDKMGDLANIISDGLFGEIDLASIAETGIFLAVLYLVGACLGYIQQFIMASVTLKTSYRMRAELSAKINRVPQKYFVKTAQGDILSVITNDVSTLQQGLSNSLPTIIGAATQFIGCLIMMLITEWRLALISLAITVLGIAFVFFIMKNSQKFFVARQKSLGELNGFIEETYSGHEVIKVNRADGQTEKTFDKLNEKVYDANRKSQFLSGAMQPLMSVISNAAYVAVCVFGSIFALQGSINFGVIVSFIL